MGPYEWLVVIGIVLLLFGGTQIPKLARSLGQAQKEFKQGSNDGGNKAVVKAPEAEEKKES